MINTQKKEKSINLDGDVQIHSIFKTIQGEGPFAGAPAIFVRLAGCNLDCPWCDTIYTGDGVETLAPDIIVAKVVELASQAAHKTKLVVITGGEPFRQHFGKLVTELHAAGFTVQIETNGTLYLEEFPYHLATIVCSPKLAKIHEELMPWVRHFKYVAEANNISMEDGLPISVLGNTTRKIVARPDLGLPCVVYLQPMDAQDDEKNAANLKAVVASCQTFGYNLCIQMHKIVGVE